MPHTCQSGSVSNHHSCGATPTVLATATRVSTKTSPAAQGSRQARATAAVRWASVPGAVPTASTAASVDRTIRAVATRLLSPMKNAAISGVASRSV